MVAHETTMRERRTQRLIRIDKLHLDKENPRLPPEIRSKTEDDLLTVLYKAFNLDELAESMAQNGYFDEEPMVVIPKSLPKALSNSAPNSEKYLQYVGDEDTDFTVVEGNRRAATIKLLLDPGARARLGIKHWRQVESRVLPTIEQVPAIIYKTRSEVVPYLGVRHIVGIQKWDSFAKARYVAHLVDEGTDLADVESQIGDTQGSARKNYVCYKLLDQAVREFDINPKPVQQNFSLLMLSIGQGNIKRFLGLPKKLTDVDPESPVPPDNTENLRDFISWLFGDSERPPVIQESRDITKQLTHVVTSEDAIKHLKLTRNLAEAFDRSDGEEQMVIRYLATANRKLEGALGLIHRHKTADVLCEVEKCVGTVERLTKVLKE